jgi:hypothetical protein
MTLQAYVGWFYACQPVLLLQGHCMVFQRLWVLCFVLQRTFPLTRQADQCSVVRHALSAAAVLCEGRGSAQGSVLQVVFHDQFST